MFIKIISLIFDLSTPQSYSAPSSAHAAGVLGGISCRVFLGDPLAWMAAFGWCRGPCRTSRLLVAAILCSRLVANRRRWRIDVVLFPLFLWDVPNALLGPWSRAFGGDPCTLESRISLPRVEKWARCLWCCWIVCPCKIKGLWKMIKNDLLFVVVKWRKTSHQLIENYTDEVPIYSFPMSTFFDHFWRQIGIGATKRICTMSVSFDALPWQTKISEKCVPISIKHNVIRFQVSKYYVLLVQSFNSTYDFSYIPLGFVFRKLTFQLQILAQITSRAKLHYHV